MNLMKFSITCALQSYLDRIHCRIIANVWGERNEPGMREKHQTKIMAQIRLFLVMNQMKSFLFGCFIISRKRVNSEQTGKDLGEIYWNLSSSQFYSNSVHKALKSQQQWQQQIFNWISCFSKTIWKVTKPFIIEIAHAIM